MKGIALIERDVYVYIWEHLNHIELRFSHCHAAFYLSYQEEMGSMIFGRKDACIHELPLQKKRNARTKEMETQGNFWLQDINDEGFMIIISGMHLKNLWQSEYSREQLKSSTLILNTGRRLKAAKRIRNRNIYETLISLMIK